VIASFRDRFLDLEFCWIVFIRVVRGRPGGLQFSKGAAVKITVTPVLSSIHAMWPKREKRHAWTMAGCPSHLVVHRINATYELPYNVHLVQNNSHIH